jgi:hypothetical protein
MVQIRPYVPSDRTFVLSLARRLVMGRQPWRDEQRWLTTVESRLTGSMDQHNQKTQVLIAQDEDGQPLGFATVSHSTHFTGQPQAYDEDVTLTKLLLGRLCTFFGH